MIIPRIAGKIHKTLVQSTPVRACCLLWLVLICVFFTPGFFFFARTVNTNLINSLFTHSTVRRESSRAENVELFSR